MDQSVAALQGAHIFQLWMAAQFVDGNQCDLLHQLHVHIEPARRLLRGLRVEIFAVAVELRGIGIRGAAHLRDTGDTGSLQLE